MESSPVSEEINTTRMRGSQLLRELLEEDKQPTEPWLSDTSPLVDKGWKSGWRQLDQPSETIPVD
jgi:hypothetical protein